MDQQKLAEMLNRDLADEHAAIIRYLVHSYLEGEDTPIGAGLLSRAREEMWHMHWLGMILGRMGVEPELIPAPYPFDPTSRATIFQSYIAYEQNLVPHYRKEAEAVDDPHIKRVLQREGWESAMHAGKFQKVLDKLTPEQAAGLPGGDKELPDRFIDKLQKLVAGKYTQMLQSLRNAWMFQKDGLLGWKIMDFSMTQMKQLAHLAETVAENGIVPPLLSGAIDRSTAVGKALQLALENLKTAREIHLDFSREVELETHTSLAKNVNLIIRQEEFESQEIEDWIKSGSSE